jgi:VWFA-related protein
MSAAFWRLGLGCLLVALAIDHDLDQVVFRSQVDTVTLDVLATQRGSSIPNLRAEDFIVRDNGVVQPVTDVRADTTALALHLLLDISGSLSPRDLANLQLGAAEVTRLTRVDDRLRLVTFTDVVKLHDDVDPVSLVRIFGDLAPGGNTVLRDALTSAFELAEQPGPRRPVLIVLSDGADTASFLTAHAVEDTARQGWASVFAISPHASRDELLPDLVELTGGELIVLDRGLADLPATLRGILDRLRQRYVLGFTPSSSAKGWHDLDVRVKKPNAKVVARRGYLRR